MVAGGQRDVMVKSKAAGSGHQTLRIRIYNPKCNNQNKTIGNCKHMPENIRLTNFLITAFIPVALRQDA